MRQITFTLLVLSVILFGCKKDDSSVSLIVGKWSILPTKYESFNNGSASSSMQQNYPGDYAEFKKDGMYQSVSRGAPDAGSYKIEGDSLFFGNTGRKAFINTLSNTSLIYSFKNEINSAQYEVITFSLKK